MAAQNGLLPVPGDRAQRSWAAYTQRHSWARLQTSKPTSRAGLANETGKIYRDFVKCPPKEGKTRQDRKRSGSVKLFLLLERETGVEPATSSLGSWHSTTELLPLTERF